MKFLQILKYKAKLHSVVSFVKKSEYQSMAKRIMTKIKEVCYYLFFSLCVIVFVETSANRSFLLM